MRPINGFVNSTIVLFFLTFLFACNKENLQTPASDDTSFELAAKGVAGTQAQGYVYTMSNEQTQNSLLCYAQHGNGSLTYMSTVLSGGKGSGAGLGSQGSIVISADHKWLFAVNAGDNTISSFRIRTDGSLTLSKTVASRGTMPIGLAIYDHWLYVVNSTPAGIAGFTVMGGGDMVHIPGSDQALSMPAAGPAQVSFTPLGDKLIVTEKGTNMISAFNVNSAGKAGTVHSTAAAGQTPFGFGFAGDKYLIVTEASGGAPNASTVSSYNVNGWTNLVNGPIATNQTAVCWIAVAADGRNAYVTNTGSNTISSFAIGATGRIRLLQAAAATTGTTPIDVTLSGNNFFLYNINATSHSISVFKRNNSEKLISLGEVTGLPAHAVGIAAY